MHYFKSETLLDVLPRRKLKALLHSYAQQHSTFLFKNPRKVVMDLARACHTWISDYFPCVLRVADRFMFTDISSTACRTSV
ncbi:transposase [Paenibacillus sp. A3M_27_13]|uniref:transposase n=1 Tax=unclassified Paenibacillus TaxID=185978 RepID=UPI00349F3342